MSRRVGVLGGMFDPVHSGHVEVALAVQSELKLDEVRLVPCAIPNHKASASAGAIHRANMLRLAIDGLPGLMVDERELQRKGTSYTVDTLAEMRAQFPATSLVFIQGEDSFRTLPQWHHWRQLLEYAHICVMSRRSEEGEALYRPELDALLLEYGVDSVETLFQAQQGYILQLDEVDNPVSSTMLREALLQRPSLANAVNKADSHCAGSGTTTPGKALDSSWLDSAVLSYIEQHALYRDH